MPLETSILAVTHPSTQLTSDIAGSRLVESCSVKYRVVATGNEFSRQMRAVVHSEQIPPVHGTDNLARTWHQWQRGIIETVIVTSSAIHYVPWGSGVVQFLGRTVIDGRLSLVEMLVTMEDEVDTVLEQERFKYWLAFYALRGTYVPRTVTSCDDPGCLLAVNRGEIFLQPIELGTRRCEWASIFGTRATWLIWCIWEIGFRVELNEVHHAVVPGVPKILKSAGLSTGHTRRAQYDLIEGGMRILPMGTVAGEI
jgi:hypothetical protein